MRIVTRLEIADALSEAFGPRGAAKTELLEAARHADAAQAVLDELDRLPDRRYPTMRALWDHLPEVPLDETSDRARTGTTRRDDH